MSEAAVTPERAEDLLVRVTECLGGLGPDPQENIKQITAFCGQIMGATCALYNRLDGPLLYVQNAWNAPADLVPRDDARGHICLDVIRSNRAAPLLVRDLQNTTYAESDPGVRKYGLQTYFGHAVQHEDEAVGALCALYCRDFVPTEMQAKLLGLLAAAIRLQETQARVLRVADEGGERARRVLAALPVGVMVIDGETHRVQDANAAALAMIGARREQVIDRLCHRYVCPAETGRCPITDLGQTVDNARRTLLRSDGSSVEVLKTVASTQLDGREMLVECLVNPSGLRQYPEPESGNPDVPALRVLAVAPDAVLQAGSSCEWREAGIVAEECANASAALHKLGSAAKAGEPFHAVIVDEGLTGIDAQTFPSLVREDDRLSSVAMLLLRRNGKDGFEPFAQAGYSDQLARPLSAAALAARFRAFAVTRPLQEASRSRGDGFLAHEALLDVSILLVEDNVINREVAREMIEDLGYRCDCVKDGHEALRAVRERPYDLILMDCQMPGMDGYDATLHIRAAEETGGGTGQVPIVAITAHAMKGDRERCLECGMNDYMTKPVEIRRLSAMMTKWLPDKPGGQRPERTQLEDELLCP
jgi:CheY-like chemotaxis protein/PAS domain-containing protein